MPEGRGGKQKLEEQFQQESFNTLSGVRRVVADGKQVALSWVLLTVNISKARGTLIPTPFIPVGSTELMTAPSEYEGRLWSPPTRSEALRPDRVEAILSLNIIACERVLNNCVSLGIFDWKPLKEGTQLVVKFRCYGKYNST